MEPALQVDLGVYGVGESPGSSSPGPCRGPEANSPLRWPSGWKLGWLVGVLAGWSQQFRVTWESMGSGESELLLTGPLPWARSKLTPPMALWMEAGMAGGGASRVEPAVQSDLGVYWVGGSLSSSSPGPCHGPEANSPLRWPSGWKLGCLAGELA